MITGLWGKKIGMTQVFSKENEVVPVTAVDVSGWVVTNLRTKERDGYSAVQVGRVKDRYADKKFDINWLKKPKNYFSFVREIKLAEEKPFVVGKPVDFESILSEGDLVDVFGMTKGCGFAGVVRRYNFAGPPGSHGSTMGKKPGSLGGACSQGKVAKGKKLPGHMGNRKRAAKNLEVVQVKQEAEVVLVKGSVPGKSGSLVFLRKEKVI
ncbi:50S ribosomal protein L3 [Candidatus Dependentiae bacterium]